MNTPRLHRAAMRPETWGWQCPVCTVITSLDEDAVQETRAGTYIATGPDRFPVCANCNEQCEIAETAVTPTKERTT